jgi:IstB-like ATP binding protein
MSMRLERDTSEFPAYGYHSQEVNRYGVVEGGICASFEKFGGQNSHFNVYMNWDDIELALQKFVELAHPSAIRLEDRYDAGSILLTSQVPIDRWHDIVGNPTLADAILDRVIHNAYRIELAGESMRKRRMPEPSA